MTTIAITERGSSYLSLYGLLYLATPYTKYAAGIEAAFIDASKLAASLMREGIRVYSPIAHMHPLAIHGGLDPLDHSIWLPANDAMIRVCDAIVVAMMDGWEESYGINHEIEQYRAAGKPVFYIQPSEWLAAKPESRGA